MKIGDTIRIIRMNDDGGKDLQARMYNGRSGVVEYIDSLGQLHGTWGGLAINRTTSKSMCLGVDIL